MKFNDYWNLPKNAKYYFSPKQETHLKQKYGKLYTLHTIFSVVILLIPFIVYLCIAPGNAFEATTQSGNILGALGGFLGLVGSLAIGVGAVNCFMAFVKQYLGHWVTLIAFVVGVMLDALGLFIFTLVE